MCAGVTLKHLQFLRRGLQNTTTRRIMGRNQLLWVGIRRVIQIRSVKGTAKFYVTSEPPKRSKSGAPPSVVLQTSHVADGLLDRQSLLYFAEGSKACFRSHRQRVARNEESPAAIRAMFPRHEPNARPLLTNYANDRSTREIRIFGLRFRRSRPDGAVRIRGNTFFRHTPSEFEITRRHFAPRLSAPQFNEKVHSRVTNDTCIHEIRKSD